MPILTKLKDKLIQKLGGITEGEFDKIAECCAVFIETNCTVNEFDICTNRVLNTVAASNLVFIRDVTIAKQSNIDNALVAPWVDLVVAGHSVVSFSEKTNIFTPKAKNR